MLAQFADLGQDWFEKGHVITMLRPSRPLRPRYGVLGGLFGFFRSHPARRWQPSDEPLPQFDLATGALGSFRLGENWEQAEFLGRPDRVDQPAGMRFHYFSRGFELYFEGGECAEIACIISTPAISDARSDQGYARPQLKGGIQLTPETSVDEVQRVFGTPASDDTYRHDRTLMFDRGRYYMEFIFEQPSGRLLTWSAALEDG